MEDAGFQGPLGSDPVCSLYLSLYSTASSRLQNKTEHAPRGTAREASSTSAQRANTEQGNSKEGRSGKGRKVREQKGATFSFEAKRFILEASKSAQRANMSHKGGSVSGVPMARYPPSPVPIGRWFFDGMCDGE
ncbi:unnamed protein product [Lota lota]